MSEDVRQRLGRLFDVGEPRRIGPGERQPGELFRGTGWLVSEGTGGLELHYVSGEMGGPDRMLPITAEEAETLRVDAGRLNDILLAHGAG